MTGTGREDSARSDSIGLFLLLVIALSAIFEGLIVATGHLGGAGGKYGTALMWSPAIAALLTIHIRRLDIRAIGWGWGDGRWPLLGYVLPFAYTAAAYLAVWLFRLAGFPNQEEVARIGNSIGWPDASAWFVIPFDFLLVATAGMASSMATALGEEIGWRGFLAPRMTARFGFAGGAVLTGLIWATWHMPVLLFADYNSGTPWWFALSCFTVMIVSSSIMLTWLRLRSGSVWPCAILHASHNLFIQDFFTPLTATTRPVTIYAIDEFGFALPIVIALIAIWFLRRGVRPIQCETPPAVPAGHAS